jgi:8-oxo-dGTP pyrophosphatase MutT (NUDIX family)
VSLAADALAVLEGWRAPDDDQEAVRRRYVDYVRAHPDALARSGRPDHLTASTLVLGADRSSVLLTLHAKAGRWFQLGGHCEPTDTTLAGAAAREAREESGLAGLAVDPVPVQLSEHAVPFCGSSTGPDGRPRPVHHLDVRFMAVVPPDARPALSAESLDLRWWPVDALPDPEPDLRALVELALARIG